MFGRTGSNLPIEQRVAGFSICVAFLVIFFLICYSLEKKRKESIEKYAKKHDFTYRENDSHFPYRSTQIIATIDKNYDRSFENIIIGDKNGVHFWTSDYNYKTYNRNSIRPREVHKTVCVIHRKKTNIPDFVVRSGSSYIYGGSGKHYPNAIVFEEDNGFSRKYILYGANEKNIRRVFDASVREAFIQIRQKGYDFEWSKDGLILFYNGFLSIYERMRMVDDASKIFEIIVGAAVTK